MLQYYTCVWRLRSAAISAVVFGSARAHDDDDRRGRTSTHTHTHKNRDMYAISISVQLCVICDWFSI